MTEKTNDSVIYYVNVRREIETTDFNGITVRYIGTLPGERTVFFSYGKGGGKDARRSVYVSALEALKSGYSIAYTPSLYLSYAVEKAAADTVYGSLYAFVPTGLESVRRHVLRDCLITGGGVISIVENDAEFSYEAMLGKDYLASSMSSAVVMCSFRGRYVPHFVDTALRDGKSLCCLRTGLSCPVLRQLVREGAEAVDSFSSFLSNPQVIAYSDENGIYGIEDSRFDIMSVTR